MSDKTKTAYTVETFSLMDGTEVEARPLPIKRLRQAQKKINAVFAKMQKNAKEQVAAENDENDERDEEFFMEKTSELDEELEDTLLDITLWVMKSQDSCKKFLDPDNGREQLEDIMDQQTLYEIIRVSTGYDFLATQKRAQEMMQEVTNQTY